MWECFKGPLFPSIGARGTAMSRVFMGSGFVWSGHGSIYVGVSFFSVCWCVAGFGFLCHAFLLFDTMYPTSVLRRWSNVMCIDLGGAACVGRLVSLEQF
jgi:hypothetical protein